MKNKETYSILYDCCRWNLPDHIKEILESTMKDIDLTYDDGLFFRLAISSDSIEKSIEMLNILLNYYEQTKLQGDPHSREYLYSKTKLQDILEDALDTFSVSPEIEAIVNKYIVPKVDSDTEEELEDFLSNSSTTFEDIPEYSSDNDAKSNDEMPVMGEGY